MTVLPHPQGEGGSGGKCWDWGRCLRYCPGVGPTIEKIGIIAGARSLPLVFARQARAMGMRRIVAVAFTGETSPEIESVVDEVTWLKVGQLSKMIAAFTGADVHQCVMLGQIAPRNLFDVRPDLRAMGLLLRLKERNAHTLFGAIADELKKEGVELVEATPWLRPLMHGVGFRLGPKLSEEQREEVSFGFRMAKEIARLEIGQSVVVKRGTVLAVEGFEGTDRCLARGGELAGRDGGAVAVKVAREKHDMRFDVPCIGAGTIEACAAARVSVLAVEAGRTLFLDEADLAVLAKRHGVSVVTTDGNEA